MLVLKCAGCKSKLWKYDKIGQGEVFRCHKDRIVNINIELKKEKDRLKCSCGMETGIDKGSYIKMNRKAFFYSGTKRNK